MTHIHRSSVRYSGSLIIFFGMLCGLLMSECAQAANSQENWDQLMSGEIMVKAVRNNEGTPGVRATFIVAASREDIWRVLVDYENFPKFFNGIKNLRVIDEDTRGAHIEFWINAIVVDLHYILYRKYVEPGYRLTWRRVSGDLERIEGSWAILATPNREAQLLIYESYVEIGFSMATWLMQLRAKQETHKMAVQLRDWIEYRADLTQMRE